jgi:TM2 domain-containing membrane protein YozV
MNTTNFCAQCGNPLEPDALFCSKCGAKIDAATIESQQVKKTAPIVVPESPKSGKVTLLLCIFLGMLGAHRFYVGKLWTGILMLLSGGAIGVWVLIDLYLIVKNKYEDKEGNQIKVTHNLSKPKESLLIAGSVAAWLVVFMSSVAAVIMYATSSLVTVVDNQLAALQMGQIEKAYSYNSTEFQKNVSIDGFKNFVSQFPALINNANSSFSERKIDNHSGRLVGVLTAKDGTKTPVAYRLVQENGQWRILDIQILTSLPK